MLRREGARELFGADRQTRDVAATQAAELAKREGLQHH
jgi:hypothetical protein